MVHLPFRRKNRRHSSYWSVVIQKSYWADGEKDPPHTPFSRTGAAFWEQFSSLFFPMSLVLSLEPTILFHLCSLATFERTLEVMCSFLRLLHAHRNLGTQRSHGVLKITVKIQAGSFPWGGGWAVQFSSNTNFFIEYSQFLGRTATLIILFSHASL
jgi:hypothetical protein